MHFALGERFIFQPHEQLLGTGLPSFLAVVLGVRP